ncbi:hypothetical protein KCP73_15810 [Salmonella enterica subsp. enterica]|nr:hypothetical protein KCP73_15810 [Salmonella enterica subsp. enterica]
MLTGVAYPTVHTAAEKATALKSNRLRGATSPLTFPGECYNQWLFTLRETCVEERPHKPRLRTMRWSKVAVEAQALRAIPCISQRPLLSYYVRAMNSAATLNPTAQA